MKNTTYLILAFLVCQLSFSKVTVDPVMPTLPNISVCDLDSNPLDGMTMFNLSTQDAYIISGQSSMPSSYIVTYHLTLSGANSGTSAIASPASYLGSNGQVIYARIINIATGFFAVGPFSLIVNPPPSISNKTVSICNGSTFSVTPINALPDIVPVGTTYTWAAPVISPAGSVVGGYAQSTPQMSISQTLTGPSNINATATYTVTATTPSGCTSTFMMVVQINSRPIISNKTVSICSGGTFNVTPTNTLPDVVPVGTTYTCTAPVYSSPNISGGSALVVGQTEIAQTLTNSGSTVETATYTVTATSGAAPNSCSSVFTITVTINPSITLPVFPNVVACGSYVLPALVYGNYFSGSNGTGVMMAPGLSITTSQEIHVFATNGSCTADESYMVIINPSIVPTFTPISPLCLNSTAPPFQLTSIEGISGTWTPSMINTMIPGSFVYVFTPDGSVVGQECAVPTTILVTVLPLVSPIITATGDSNIVYVDYPTETVVQPLLLTATTPFSGALTYQWYLNGTAISGATNPTFLVDSFAIPDEPRSFSVEVSSVQGCFGTSSIVVIQAAVPAPSGLVSQTFTPGQTLADLVVTGTNILWYPTLTGRNATSTPLSSNTLLVDGTTYYATQTINGYESPTRFAVTVHSTLSNKDFEFVDFKYSPNPVNDYLFIQAKATIKTVAVYNALGQLVLSQNGNSMEIKLDLSQLKSGNYFVKIQSDLKQNSFKIIKK